MEKKKSKPIDNVIERVEKGICVHCVEKFNPGKGTFFLCLFEPKPETYYSTKLAVTFCTASDWDICPYNDKKQQAVK
jgi:hypothetical protein